MPAARGHWGTRFGFILAATGSAVGLGNIWKFPYMTGQNGGAAFLVIYLCIVFSVGVSVMLAEFVIGRASERNPVGAFAILKGKAWPVVGFMGVAAGFIILSFYSVVAGWTLAYIVKTAAGLLTAPAAADFGKVFGGFISDPFEPLWFHALFMALTIGVVLGGVHHGIENWCKVLLPTLFVLLIILAVRGVTLPGAYEGLRFYLAPDFSKVTGETFNAALSQAFFSLSLGMGAMITYGSYLSHRENLPGAAAWVTLCDALVAVVAGLVIMPAVFAFHLDPGQGPSLIFITLPKVFAQMPAGTVFAMLFFILLAIAALTSAVSLLEVVVAYFVDERGVGRKRAALITGGIIFLLGIPSSLSLGVMGDWTLFGKTFFDLMDYTATNLLLPLGGLAIALFVGWVIWPKAVDEASSGGVHRFALAPGWRILCRYIAPLAIAWILFQGL